MFPRATGPHKTGQIPSPLADLHPDVLGLVVDHLDRTSAVSLAQTCSSIRPVAEQAVWKELNISVHRTFMPGATAWNHHRPLGGKRLFAIREEHTWGTTKTVDPSYPGRTEAEVEVPLPSVSAIRHATNKPSSLERYYFALVAHLQADPRRLKSVRTIFIDLDHLLHPLFADLLRLVAPTLQQLHFNPPGISYEPNATFPSMTIRGIFEVLGDVGFVKLRTLYLPLANDWKETISTTLRSTSRLRSLTIAVEQPYSGSWGATTEFSPASPPSCGWPILLDLEELCVEEMSPAFEGLVMAMVKGSRSIRRVTIREPAQTWNPGRHNEVIDTLAFTCGLRYLACPHAALATDVIGKYREVEELSATEERQPWGQPALEAVTIPPLQGMKALYSYAPINEGRSVTLASNGESRGLPPALRRISATTLQTILAATSLLYIQLPGSPTREFGLPVNDAQWQYWGSKSCAEKHDRAVLIRTYEHETTGESFTHCRGYSAHHSHIEEGIIHRTEDVWEEHVDYMGACPPAGVLGEVYEAIGHETGGGWRVPGRHLRMSESAWEALRRWRAEVRRADGSDTVAPRDGGTEQLAL